jgi:hypothetical protein
VTAEAQTPAQQEGDSRAWGVSTEVSGGLMLSDRTSGWSVGGHTVLDSVLGLLVPPSCPGQTEKQSGQPGCEGHIRAA